VHEVIGTRFGHIEVGTITLDDAGVNVINVNTHRVSGVTRDTFAHDGDDGTTDIGRVDHVDQREACEVVGHFISFPFDVVHTSSSETGVLDTVPSTVRGTSIAGYFCPSIV
jgi:hypothetical protein